MKLTLIGLSNSGKTYWSKKLEEKGFRRFCAENMIVAEILDYLRDKKSEDENLVIDTTANIIYLDKNILKELTRLTRIVFLDTPEIIWNDLNQSISNFHRSNGEPYKEALNRNKLYKKYAGITIDSYLLRYADYNVEDFLALIRREISNKWKHQVALQSY